MDDTNAFGLLAPALPAAAAAFSLIAAVALASLIRLNKGAKINRAWGLMAFGLACLGVAGLGSALAELGMPNLGAAGDVVAAVGGLCVMLGAAYGRSLYRALVK